MPCCSTALFPVIKARGVAQGGRGCAENAVWNHQGGGRDMVTLLVPGIPDPQPERSDLARALPPGMVEAKHAARVDAARAAGGQLRLEGLQPDDVVEIELEDGLRLWSRVDDLERDFGLMRARGGADETIALPGTLPIGGPSRGWAGWAIKGLKVLGINIEKVIGDFVADHVEGRLQPGP